MTEEQLTKLLRLKRYEQPPPEYFARLLQDVHRRQRTELLQRPLWKIAVERMQTFFSEHSMGHVSYAGALAVVLVGGMTVIRLMTPSAGLKEHVESVGAVASATSAVASATVSPSEDKLLRLQNASLPKLVTQPLQAPQASLQSSAREPRYVIDARPVSYEPSSSFNF
jgi:hypothetical protein